jgi:DNA helicase-2/ATP-dependent DNA helicase PcrA
MTRARERLYLLNARRRYLFGQEQSNQPSRFLRDIPRELLEEAGGGAAYARRSQRTAAYATPYPSHNLAAVTTAFDDIEIVPDPPEEHDGVYIGMKVRHAKFGVGTVRKVEGEGEGQKVIVWFNSVGPKKLLLRFAGLERA